jgi:transketolase
MPCVEEFLSKPKDYRDLVLPKNKKVIVIEAGSSFGWHRIYNDKIYYMTVDDFGISGTKDEVLRYTKFDYETIKNKIFNIISNNE